jgi:hypothetical protein
LFPDGAPESLTVAQVVGALAALLGRTTENLHDADLALAAEVADDTAYRDQRDEATELIREDLIDTADLISSSYGDEHLSTFGLKGETPRSSDLLVNNGSNVEELLRSRPLPAEPKRGRPPVEAAALAAVIREHVDQLRGALESVKNEEREYERALVARDASLDEWQRVYQSVAGALSALYLLAGQSELASRVRPPERRRSGSTTTPTTPEPNPTAPTPTEPVPTV